VKVPRGIIEDVLIKVDKFYYPVDFIVLDRTNYKCRDSNSSNTRASLFGYG
jgi:hypothetical protein